MNKEQQELLDDAYKNYEKSIIQSHKEHGLEGFEYLNKESFIERIGTDAKFSEKWGLKIEERELSLEERVRIYGVDKIQINDAGHYEHSYTQFKVDEAKIPTKLITITYNDKTI